MAKLPATLKTLGELQLKGIRQSLIAKKTITSKQTLTVEAWPIRDDRGRLTWCFARWRVAAERPLALAEPGRHPEHGSRTPSCRRRSTRPCRPTTRSIFGAADDYGWNVEPAFSNCIWVERAADPALARCWEAWLPSAQRAAYSQRTDLASRLALVVPPPARLNGAALTYTVAATDTKTTWPSAIVWTAAPATPGPAAGSAVITSWPAGFDAAYRADLLAMDGEAPAVFPISGRSVTFTNKNNALADNQLADVFSYLEERYAQLGLDTWRQSFTWRGMPQTNLVAVIPGTNSRLAPLLLADHVDTALDEDLALKSIYLAVPGADDNASATAALLRAATVLKDRQPERPIWLVHFTGEEFPADDLGARALVSKLLGDDQDIAGMVLLDMIGFAGVGETQFQINPGPHAAVARHGLGGARRPGGRGAAAHAAARAALLGPQLPVQHRRDHPQRERLSGGADQRAHQLLHAADARRLPRHGRHLGQGQLPVRGRADQGRDRDDGEALRARTEGRGRLDVTRGAGASRRRPRST